MTTFKIHYPPKSRPIDFEASTSIYAGAVAEFAVEHNIEEGRVLIWVDKLVRDGYGPYQYAVRRGAIDYEWADMPVVNPLSPNGWW